ncbi:hypothetical protein CONLIGDRAFT_678913 [Coniochaeta ligniaria NRRL 30616]|uniref:Zn(2)-C6 fungal-type domain-containing protein n=1 Tax=Coniochaeta ligniaria NRRL 30616 TaxID=1408157 RepID=A0A1J7JXJ2_9PEZI|nr:hypothetical protein CONLIGDRAFT_678913 [Coniochaeta ligniaria NRRL 30616]
MGRRPNSLILQYFERGPKLADNSNRYPHTCKACGENFPKGRIDSLTNHLTKKCPAISEADRINACLTLHGIHHAANRGPKSRQVQPNGPPVDLPMMQRDWTALETLAEVSRQIEASEKQPAEDQGPAQAVNGNPQPAVAGATSAAAPLYTGERFELHELSAFENLPVNAESQQLKDAKEEDPSPENPNRGALQEGIENLTALIQSVTESESANLSMAAAATARLHPSLHDSQSPGEDVPPTDATAEQSLQQQQPINGDQPLIPVTTASQQIPANSASQPWGEMTYIADPFQPNFAEAIAHSAADLAKSSFRMDTGGNGLNDAKNAFHMDTTSGGLNGSKSRHSRARFDANRRKEVQEVRKIGACIRCRILRKTCSKGHPCDTCRKVLSPRVWRSGCVRTKFSEQLDLYSAGVQIVLAQNRVNGLKARWPLSSHGSKIVASHFPDKAISLSLNVLERDLFEETPEGESNQQPVPTGTRSVVMIDNESQDVPGRLEAYMREVLPEFSRLEPSHFMRVTLEMALRVAEETKDDLLKKSLELWGLVELLDRERQWSIRVVSNGVDHDWINEDAQEEQQEIFTTVCLQLAAAAERKAGSISKSLLTGMQRVLQDSKTKIGFSMYFATLILLNSVEKSTWAFKAWEQDNLRPLWPLPKDPSTFSQQGYVIADLLRMLLGIRRALPRTACRQEDGILITQEEDPLIREYFEALNLNFAEVQAKQESPAFSPTDPRSFELLFCSTLLLPGRD